MIGKSLTAKIILVAAATGGVVGAGVVGCATSGGLGPAALAGATASSQAGPATGGGTAFAVPAAATSAAPATTSPSGPAAPGDLPARWRRLINRGVHGEFTVRTKDGYVLADFQRGSVTAVSATSITVHSTDGFSASYAVNGGTSVRIDGGPGSLSSIRPGAKVLVVAEKTGQAVTARRIVVAR
jgi:hypothetical protein